MLFDSPIFFVFLVLVVAAYWQLKWRFQNVLLLLASYCFYGWWDWRFLLLMAGSTALDFFIARQIARTTNEHHRRYLLAASLLLNFTFLGVFKYFNFFAASLSSALHGVGITSLSLPVLRVLLPPGISFYTFQEVAYIVDVYHRKLEPAESIVDYALFISLFPHLIAGPIQRPSHLLPQVQNPRTMDDRQFFDGLMLILSGLFRKCVIADNCALLANAAFSGSLGPSSLPVTLIGTYAFAWQIYGDFSGYSDIARGAAQLMGFHFMVNFRQPYLAESLQQFWRRWHISLSTWLRDYLYIPLGGSAKGEVQTYRNLLTTMVLGGLWHGANWTFVVWGAIHGSWLAAERFVRRQFGLGTREAASSSFLAIWIRRVAVFHLVCLAWVFFRAASVHEALQFLGGMRNLQWDPGYWTAAKFLIIFSLPLFLLDLVSEARDEEYAFQKTPALVRVGLGMATLTFLTFFSANSANAFIYFQF